MVEPVPRWISRQDALERIRAEGGEPGCLMCGIRDGRVGPTYTVFEDDVLLVVLPRYVRRWGSALVLPREHVTSFGAVTPELWAHTNAIAHRTAQMVERVQAPLRCYVASTGSPSGERVNTSMHLHVHVVPITDPEDRPRDVFSWDEGVMIAEAEEWNELQARYREGFR
jgi:diadenosine tetraphosphate (Ap4A) HIT family hydrolase